MANAPQALFTCRGHPLQVTATRLYQISHKPRRDELAKAKEVLDKAVGIGMRSRSGVAADMFSSLADAGINIKMISTSEIKTAVIVAEDDVEQAARVVHDGFGLGDKPILTEA